MIRCVLICLALLWTQAANAQWASFQDSASAPLPPGLNRSAFNMVLQNISGEYVFIDFLNGGAGQSPQGSGWSSAPIWNSGILDAEGFPCTKGPGGTLTPSCPYSGATNPAQGANNKFNFGVQLPATVNYGGVYCVQGKGSATAEFLGSVSIAAGNSWTRGTNASQTCAGFNGSSNNCTTSNVSASGSGDPITLTLSDDTWSGWCIAITASGLAFGAGGNAQLLFSNDDPNNNGHYVKDVHWYQIGDGADFASGCPGLSPSGGCLARHAWKSQIVNIDPFMVRFLGWMTAPPSTIVAGAMRFTNRATPANMAYASVGYNFVGQLPYGLPTENNQFSYTIAGVTGTPANMQHGEEVTFIPIAHNARGVLGNISAISIAGTTVTINLNTADIFTTGDSITIKTDSAGNSRLNYYTPTVTVDSTTQFHFTFAAAASLSPCSGGCGTAAEQFLLQVGSGGNRTAYPVFGGDGHTQFVVGNDLLVDAQYWRFCFDKNIIASQDASGNYSYGAWRLCYFDSVPYEYQVEVVNELNAMSPAHPINLWTQIPIGTLICYSGYSDPDCTSGDDWPANMTNTVMNGANGFSGLNAPAWAIFEFVNETWAATQSSAYLEGLSGQPATAGHIGCGTSSNVAWNVDASEYIADDINKSGFTKGRVWNSLGGSYTYFGGTSYAIAVATNPGSPFTSCVPTPLAMVPISMFPAMHLAPYVSSPTLRNVAVTGAASGAGGAIELTLSATAGNATTGMTTGDTGVVVANVGGTTEANGTWTITVNDASHVTLQGSTFVHSYTSGGTLADPPNITTLAATWASDVNTFGFNSSQAIADLRPFTDALNADTSNVNAQSFAGTEIQFQLLLNVLAPYKAHLLNYEGWWDDNIVNFGFITALSCTSGTVTATMNRVGNAQYGSPMVIQGVSVAGYNGAFTTTGSANSFTYSVGGSCPATPSATNYQGYYGYAMQQNDAFLLAAKNSSAWATDTVGFYNWAASTAFMGDPGFFVLQSLRWGVTAPDTFGATNTEGGGNNAAWTAIGTANQGRQNFLLKRDLDPAAANDNTPMGLNEAA